MQDDKAKHKALTTLFKSKGWAILTEVMEQEILASAKSMGGSATMGTDELHFRRGAIFAADRLLTLPEIMLNNLDTSILMFEAMTQHDPQNGDTQ